MAGYATNLPLDGTAAMKPITNTGYAQPKIIAFPSTNRSQSHSEKKGLGLRSASTRVPTRLRNYLLSSEMYCSLMQEDARGVAYKLFSKCNIGALVLVSFLVAVFSIAYGA